METRQCYHVTVFLEGGAKADVYFEPETVHAVIPPASKDLLSRALQSIGHAAAFAFGQPKGYYISQLQKERSKGEGGGFSATVSSVDQQFPQTIYFSARDLFESGQQYPKGDVPLRSLPRDLNEIALSEKARKKIQIRQNDRNLGNIILQEREKVKKEKNAHKKEEEQKKWDMEAKERKVKQDLLAAKKIFGVDEKTDLIKLAAADYDFYKAEFEEKFNSNSQSIKKIEDSILHPKAVVTYDPEILSKRIAKKQKDYRIRLFASETMSQHQVNEYKDKIDKIQKGGSDSILVTAYEQYDRALAGLYHKALKESLNQFTINHFKTHADDLGEIALAAGLARPVIQKGVSIAPEYAHGIYCKRVTDHLANKSFEEMKFVIDQIITRLKSSDPNYPHPFINALNAAIVKATSDEKGLAKIEAFSLGAVKKNLQEAAEKIKKETQIAMAKNLAIQAKAIQEYQQFLENERTDLISVQGLRIEAQDLFNHAANQVFKEQGDNRKKGAMTFEKKDVADDPLKQMESVVDAINQFKADVSELLRKSEREEKAIPSDKRKMAKDSREQMRSAIEEINSIAKNNLIVLKEMNEGILNEYITAEEAKKIIEKTRNALRSSYEDAEIQYHAARWAAQAIEACQIEVTLLQKKKKEIEKIHLEARQLKQEIAKAKDDFPEDKTSVDTEVKSIAEAIEKIETLNSKNFSCFERPSAELKEEKLGGMVKEKVDQNQKILKDSIEKAEQQIANARMDLEVIKRKYAPLQLLVQKSELRTAQKELYDLIKSALVEQIFYWNKQRFSGGTKVEYNGKLVTVPTGIGEMINIIQGNPEKQTGNFSLWRKAAVISRLKPEPDSAEIVQRLKKFGEISSARLYHAKGFFIKNRRNVTHDFYRKLLSLSDSAVKIDESTDIGKIRQQRDKFKEIANFIKGTDVVKNLASPQYHSKKAKKTS